MQRDAADPPAKSRRILRGPSWRYLPQFDVLQTYRHFPTAPARKCDRIRIPTPSRSLTRSSVLPSLTNFNRQAGRPRRLNPKGFRYRKSLIRPIPSCNSLTSAFPLASEIELASFRRFGTLRRDSAANCMRIIISFEFPCDSSPRADTVSFEAVTALTSERAKRFCAES